MCLEFNTSIIKRLVLFGRSESMNNLLGMTRGDLFNRSTDIPVICDYRCQLIFYFKQSNLTLKALVIKVQLP